MRRYNMEIGICHNDPEEKTIKVIKKESDRGEFVRYEDMDTIEYKTMLTTENLEGQALIFEVNGERFSLVVKGKPDAIYAFNFAVDNDELEDICKRGSHCWYDLPKKQLVGYEVCPLCKGGHK